MNQPLRFYPASLTLVASLLTLIPSLSYGDPPPWAPAHGWRAKENGHYTGYTGHQWSNDYGVISGRCDRQAIRAVAQPSAGTVFAGKVEGTTGTGAATLLGTIIDTVVGADAPKPADTVDRACMAQALELSRDHNRVTWVNPSNGVSYLLTPTNGYEQGGRACREFLLTTTVRKQNQYGVGTACQDHNGAWHMVKSERLDRPDARAQNLSQQLRERDEDEDSEEHGKKNKHKKNKDKKNKHDD